MKFYNRENEISFLNKVTERSLTRSHFTLIVGRRRIGKTCLLMKTYEEKRAAYLFVAKKSEAMLCAEFMETIKESLTIPLFGEIKDFKTLFEALLVASQNEPFTLIIDEFQEFYNINSSVYSDMQNLWDRYKEKSRMNLIVCGSVYSLMKHIFENSKEPLFGRADEKIVLKAFGVPVLKHIISDYKPSYTNKNLLAYYIFSGGVAKYVEYFTDRNAFTLELILDEILRENSILLEEGKNVLIEEFGREYTTYFSILSLIASSKTARSEIESVLQKDIGGYLDRMENEYGIIQKVKPIFSKPQGRLVKYFILDNFLNFWFRFIFKYRSAVEIHNFKYIKDIVIRDYDTFSERFLEKYFVDKLSLEGQYTQIGSYWERDNKNEIDIIAINEQTKQALIVEVKVNPQKIQLDILKQKAVKILGNLEGYSVEYKGFSVEDM